MSRNMYIPLQNCIDGMEDSNFYFIFIQRKTNSPEAYISRIIDSRHLDSQPNTAKMNFFKDSISKAIMRMSNQEYYLFRQLFTSYFSYKIPEDYFDEKERFLEFLKSLKADETNACILDSVANNWYLVQPVFLDICKFCKNELPNDIVDNISDVDYLYEKLLHMKLQNTFELVLKNITISS